MCYSNEEDPMLIDIHLKEAASQESIQCNASCW